MSLHQLQPFLEAKGVPVLGFWSAALGHWVEAHGGHAIGWKPRVETGLLHFLGHPGRILGDLCERDIGVDHIEARGL